MKLTRKTKKLANNLFRNDLSERWQLLNLKYIEQLETRYADWVKRDDTGIDAAEISQLQFMLFQVSEQNQAISRLKKNYQKFTRNYLKSIDEIERQQHILNFSADLGANSKTLKGDNKAFSRWFGRDALVERFQAKLFEQQRCLGFYLDRLGSLCKHILIKQKVAEQTWKRLGIEDVIRPLLAFEGDERVRVETFKCLSRAVGALPSGLHNTLVSDTTVQYIYRSALERNQDIWIQCEAISLLKVLSKASLKIVLEKRINSAQQGDDLFVRRHAVRVISEFQQQMPELQSLLKKLMDDPGASVRQLVPEALLKSDLNLLQSTLKHLLTKDESSAVRASALLVVPSLYDLKKSDSKERFLLMKSLLVNCFEAEGDEFVLKVALKTIVDCLPLFNENDLLNWCDVMQHQCEMLHSKNTSLAIRRMAAQTLEWCWLYQNKVAYTLYDDLNKKLKGCVEGQRIKLDKNIMQNETMFLGRVMSLLAQQDFGLTLEKSWRGFYLRKGERFAFRWWRFLHELRHSSTDKRQSHSHTIGRHYHGLLHAPSSILAELAETRVPGEPLYISEENASRYYLPLVDHALSALDQSWPTRYFKIVSAEGVTELRPPANAIKRWRAHMYISSHFAEFSRMRNWQDSSGDPAQYINALRDLGFEVRFTPNNAASPGDSSVSRFFPAILPISWDAQFNNLEDYFFSVYENTLFHLGVFVLMVGSYFFARHIYLNQMLRRARNKIPLVIGGWGTRGKSGTERLKAALFNALGYNVVSKTSGCEAMFLHAPSYGPLREMFLFRPYDKATIWEQVDVVKLSQKLGCDVFLWECMGLTPSYVHVLQRNWMRDDISTITNTYPDHEDLQGPAGYDIPQVMTNFIPENSSLITTEEQMLPILRDHSQRLNTSIRSVGWLQAGLLTDDILQRFPYEEHPYNIALVLEVADELGIDRDYTLKEIADNVVPDLGVLKTFPLVHIAGRKLEFINGMSANERFGALGNWSRMEMDKHSLQDDANIWVSTVINNRADRVPRSQVFANLMVQDIVVDRHFIIGDNLQGLLGYIHQSWEDQNISLFSDGDSMAKERLQAMAQRLRIPVSETQVINRLSAMLEGLNIEYESDLLADYIKQPDHLSQLFNAENHQYSELVVQQFGEDLQGLKEYQQLLDKLENISSHAMLDAKFRKQSWLWFEKKLVVVDDYYARGDEVVNCIVKHTPPGLKNRIMGMQNIKGTGLDFIYRWQAWETCYTACENLYQKELSKAEQAIKVLVQFQEYGVLCEEKVTQTLNEIKTRNWAQREEIQAEISLIASRLESSVAQAGSREDKQPVNSSWMLTLAEYIEAFMDAGDAVKRRKQATQIYQDMINKRISHERAALELQLLNKRQKGGWGSEYLNQIGKWNA